MKNKIIDIVKDDYTPEHEALAFIMFGGKALVTFDKTPKRQRNIEDYGRYLAICIVFKFKRVFLKLMREGEARIDEIINYLSSEGKKVDKVEGWIIDAINNLPDEELKSISLEMWNEAKESCGKDFDLKKLY